MNSLRTRLILGFALVALAPLALAMVLLTDRVERMVHAQAAERLEATLGGVRTRVTDDGRRIAAQMAILGRDPALKRLYLVRPVDRRALADYLAERRVLLGLDFLEALDSTGIVEDLAIERRLDPPGLALTAATSIRYQGERAGALRGGILFDATFLERVGEAAGVELIVRDGDGHTVAATAAEPRQGALDGRATIGGRSYRLRTAPLPIGAPPHPSITALASTQAAEETVGAIRIASALLGALGLGLALLLGALWSSQISRPVERLAAFSDRVAQGRWDEPLTLKSVRELETLVASLDRMRRDLRGYRDRLVVSERQAAWGQMARKVAHEVKNPLTPIAISVADLKRSYDLKRPDFPEILDQAARTVAEEVATLRGLLQEFSEFGRFPAPRPETVPIARLFEELAALYANDVATGRLRFEAPVPSTIDADPSLLKQALINLIKNGLEAAGFVRDGARADEARVVVAARAGADALEFTVSDNGPGLAPDQRANLFVPGFTTKPEGSGLGLTIVERIVSDHGGTISVDSHDGPGTTFRIVLPRTQESPEASSERGR